MRSMTWRAIYAEPYHFHHNGHCHGSDFDFNLQRELHPPNLDDVGGLRQGDALGQGLPHIAGHINTFGIRAL
jgi:hypothetical protein